MSSRFSCDMSSCERLAQYRQHHKVVATSQQPRCRLPKADHFRSHAQTGAGAQTIKEARHMLTHRTENTRKRQTRVTRPAPTTTPTGPTLG